MKKLMAVSLSALAGTFLATLLLGLPLGVRAGPVQPLAEHNGDVNCDGRVNIADPLFLLEWLFDGGSDPCAFAQESDATCTAVLQAFEELKQDLASTRPGWPARPEDRIHRTGEGPEGTTAAPQTVYVVPEDRVFILTDLVVTPPGGGSGAEILERTDEGTSIKRPLIHGPFSSALGIAFAPGSEVRLRLDDPTAGCSPTPCRVTYWLAGYLLAE